jgi:hypothetical protein
MAWFNKHFSQLLLLLAASRKNPPEYTTMARPDAMNPYFDRGVAWGCTTIAPSPQVGVLRVRCDQRSQPGQDSFLNEGPHVTVLIELMMAFLTERLRRVFQQATTLDCGCSVPT